MEDPRRIEELRKSFFINHSVSDENGVQDFVVDPGRILRGVVNTNNS
jgi:hypothetical protein